MALGLTISVADRDADYLGIEIHAANERFAGSTSIYSGLGDVSELAARLHGFPSAFNDHRTYEFGTMRSDGRPFAGGYCRLRFYCFNHAGHSAVDVAVEDDRDRNGAGTADLSFQIEAADIDQFIRSLGALEEGRSAQALLRAVG